MTLSIPLHNRLPGAVTPQKVTAWLDMLKPALNVSASRDDPYGIVVYPKAGA